MLNFATVGRPAELFMPVALFIHTMFMDHCISEQKEEGKNMELAQNMKKTWNVLKAIWIWKCF